MNFDDLFAELEEKFQAMRSRQQSAASSTDGSNLSVRLRMPVAMPGRPISPTLSLRHASLGADCVAGFDASLDYWLMFKISAVDELASIAGTDLSAIWPTAGFTFDSLLAELEVPKSIWMRRAGESRLSRVNLTACTPVFLQVGFPPASRLTPIAVVELVVVELI